MSLGKAAHKEVLSVWRGEVKSSDAAVILLAEAVLDLDRAMRTLQQKVELAERLAGRSFTEP